MTIETPDLKDIFWEALELPTNERQAFLQTACGDDPHLRHQVEQLLAAYARVGEFLESPAQAVTVPHIDRYATLESGHAIGPYMLQDRLGEGGMGIVYRARQDDPLPRTVALKIIKPGLDTEQVIARFESERQTLALMDHPGIARVFDAGSTDQGRPYFVMELVTGEPITEYADTRRLSIQARLDLFIQVCRAVQHAHQKGIIHRDLKPSNILVMEVDGTPRPKIIDFGVAKAMSASPAAGLQETRWAQIVGTPLYMSPEQADPSNPDIDTRADVYSLGVLLYELLTGVAPIDPATLKNTPLDQVCRLVHDFEPPRPSARLAHLPPETRVAVARARQADPRKFPAQLAGELDWIVQRCLEKDRNRRYASAAALADDLMRYLTDRPVEAGPPSRRYRWSRFARRNRAALLTGGVIALTMIAGTAGVAWQAVRATSAEQRAGAALTRAREHLVLARQAVDELYGEMAGRWSSTLDIESAPLPTGVLTKALSFYRRFAGQTTDAPGARARLRIGEILLQMGRFQEAAETLDRAEADFGALLAATPGDEAIRADLATSLYFRAKALGFLRENARAVRDIEQAHALWLDLTTRHPEVPEYQEQLAIIDHTQGVWASGGHNWRKAEDRLQRALARQEHLAAQFPDQPDYRMEVGQTLRDLGNLRHDSDRAAEAEPYHRRALAIHEALVAQHPTRPRYWLNLGWDYWEFAHALHTLGKHHEVADVSKRAVAVFQGLANDFPDSACYRSTVGSALGFLAVAQIRTGRRDEADPVIRRLERLGIPPDSSWLAREIAAWPFNDVAWLLVQPDTPGGSDPARTLAMADRILDARVGSSMEIGAHHIRGMALYRLGRFDEAIQDLQRANELEHNAGFAFNGFFIAMAYQQKGQPEQARDWFDRSVAWMAEMRTTDPNAFRYRDEAAAVLGISPGPMPTGLDAFAR